MKTTPTELAQLHWPLERSAPFWYTKEQKAEYDAEIKRLREYADQFAEEQQKRDLDHLYDSVYGVPKS